LAAISGPENNFRVEPESGGGAGGWSPPGSPSGLAQTVPDKPGATHYRNGGPEKHVDLVLY